VGRIETSLVFGFTRSDLAIEDEAPAASPSADRAAPRPAPFAHARDRVARAAPTVSYPTVGFAME